MLTLPSRPCRDPQQPTMRQLPVARCPRYWRTCLARLKPKHPALAIQSLSQANAAPVNSTTMAACPGHIRVKLTLRPSASTSTIPSVCGTFRTRLYDSNASPNICKQYWDAQQPGGQGLAALASGFDTYFKGLSNEDIEVRSS
jgi:hypothetical protein